MNTTNSITPREKDYSQWYLEVIDAAQLAENAPVRGCMVIRPYGYALWENMQKALDGQFKALGVKNAYFPLFIPLSFFQREAEHVEGFAKECAVVTHHRLKNGIDGKLEPDGELEEPLVVRPTSETIMYEVFSKWIKSYRDLPLLINQWANIVRWELRPRLFLRSMEFLWQEGHTVHATQAEAQAEAEQMIKVYAKFCEEYLSIPVVTGRKSDCERFAGADITYTIEAMTQDKKAIQAGTSHLLGQNFAKPFKIKFLDEQGKEQHGWQTSWGVSTRLIGALIMAHSDDKGLVLPPKIAPVPVVVTTIQKKQIDPELSKAARQIKLELTKKISGVIELDDSNERPGEKFYKWEKQGVPLRVELGPKDLAQQSAMVARRDTGTKEVVKLTQLAEYCQKLLAQIQTELLAKALKFRQANTHPVNEYSKFKESLENKGGFIQAHWCGSAKCEEQIKAETKATTRCYPLDNPQEDGQCIYCGQPSTQRIIFAKAY